MLEFQPRFWHVPPEYITKLYMFAFKIPLRINTSSLPLAFIHSYVWEGKNVATMFHRSDLNTRVSKRVLWWIGCSSCVRTSESILRGCRIWKTVQVFGSWMTAHISRRQQLFKNQTEDLFRHIGGESPFCVHYAVSWFGKCIAFYICVS